MSILPPNSQAPAPSSTYSDTSQNPNTDHGKPPSLSSSSIHFGSLSLCPDPYSPSVVPSGTMAPSAENISGPSEEVIQPGTPRDQEILSYQDTRRSFPSRSGNRRAKSRDATAATVPRGQQNRVSSDSARNSPQPHSGARRAHMKSGNHLLNFRYDPVARPQARGPPPPPRRLQKRRPYNKDLFLQANFKFVVLDTGNYAPESMDPDKMLRWEDIICLRYSTPFPVHCPICLEYPLCPQITSCGHIFCFPCILQYLLMGVDNHKVECFKRCPLCFVMMSPRDLYTVYIEKVKQYSVGDTIEFALLSRQKGSFTLSQRIEQEGGVPAWPGDQGYDPFSKFAFTSDVDLSVREAMSELDNWLVRADSGLVDDLEKLPYVSAAIDHLEQRKNFWNEKQISNSSKSSKKTDHLMRPLSTANFSDAECNASVSVEALQLAASNCNIYLVADSSPEKSDEEVSFGKIGDEDHSIEDQVAILSSLCEGNKGSLKQSNSSLDPRDRDLYNFYQVVDGQHIILHPLSMKCLLHHYGSYDVLPLRISGRILELETVTQSEAMRKRYRYLSHFSLTTTFQLCEIDVSETLPPDALAPFMDEIKKREKQRKQRARKERKEQIKAEVAAAAENVPLMSDFGQSRNFSPPFSMDDFEALGNPNTMSMGPQSVGERISFSNVTRLGFAAGYDSPGLRIEETSTVHGNGRGNSSTSSIASSTPSFANVISRAQSSENSEAPKGNETGKKGKKLARVLLSTSGGRRY